MGFKRTGANLALTLATFLICFLIAEVVLRLLRIAPPPVLQYAPRLGLSFRPNSFGVFQREGRSRVRVNARGMRQTAEVGPKRPDEYRIAVLGDSFVAALQVEEDRNFVRLLESRLACLGPRRRARTLNFGVPGFGTVQESLILEDALATGPDLVVLVFYPGNDVSNNSRVLSGSEIRPHYLPDSGTYDFSFEDSDEYRKLTAPAFRRLHYWSRYSHLLALALSTYAHTMTGRPPDDKREKGPMVLCREKLGLVGAPVFRGRRLGIYREPDADWEQAWRVTELLTADIARRVERAGAEFLLVAISAPHQVFPNSEYRTCVEARGIDLFYPGRRLARFARQKKLNFLDLAPRLRERAEREGVFFHGFDETGSGHYNEIGHRAAADAIARSVCRLEAQGETPP